MNVRVREIGGIDEHRMSERPKIGVKVARGYASFEYVNGNVALRPHPERRRREFDAVTPGANRISRRVDVAPYGALV